MDVLTVVFSALLTIPIQLSIMYLVYSRWILPAINGMVEALPSKVREYTEPYINEKMQDVISSVKMSSARFQRTVKQAIGSLDLEDVDLASDEGIEEVKNKLSNKYGMDVAIQAIGQLIASVEASRKAPNTDKGVSIW